MSAIDSQLPSSSGQDRPTDEVDRILSPGKLIILGLQHVLVMYAGAVAVPLMIGDRLGLSKEAIAMLISSDLFCCGIVTLLQCIGIGRFMGIRLPVIMSVTFAAVTPMIAIGMNPDIGLLGIFGATIAAGFITTLLAPLIGRLMPLFPPLVTGVVITSIGIARCITLFRITSVWYRKERLLKRQNFATRPVPYQKSAAGYVHRTVFVKAHVL